MRFVLVEKTRKPVIWDSNDGLSNRTFFGIEKFDCHVVSLSNEYGGGFFTVIPISPYEYRKQHPTKAKAIIEDVDDYVEFHIYDDWGSKHTMKIPKGMKKEIRIARQSAIDFGLIGYND